MYNLQLTTQQMELLKRGVEMRSLHFINKAYEENDINEKARLIDIADDYHSLWEFLVDECDLQDKMKGGE